MPFSDVQWYDLLVYPVGCAILALWRCLRRERA